MKKSLVAAGILAVFASPLMAKSLYSFGSVYGDLQRWDHGPTPIENGKARNKAVIGLEGGVGYTFGEFYGFIEQGHNLKNGGFAETSMKGTGHIYMGQSGLSLYGQMYNISTPHFNENNRVVGLGYTALSGDGWFFKPFVGAHHVSNTTGSTGWNGYMVGWSAGKDFTIGNQSFSLINWNEIEFDRSERYARANGGKEGLNGSLILLWNATSNLKTGIQYRYFANKLGVHPNSNAGRSYGDALIYRVQYSF